MLPRAGQDRAGRTGHRTRLRVAYWGPVEADVRDRASGFGIYHESMINFLLADPQVLSKTVVMRTFQRRPSRLGSLLGASRKLLGDSWRVLCEPADILLLPYPGVPLVPLTSSIKLPLALMVYFLLWMKKLVTRQIMVVIVVDLPVEQSQGFGLKDVTANMRLISLFEGVLLRLADRVVCYSDLFIEAVRRKHGIGPGKILLCRRNAYIPGHARPPAVASPGAGKETKVFYSGDLRRPRDIANLSRVLDAVRDCPQATVYVCGIGGEWIGQRRQENVTYLGLLDYRSYDAVASRCDIGLLVYPSEGYYDLTPTCKYSAYVANGLALLCSTARTVKACVTEDGVGVAVPAEEIPGVLRRWVEDPGLFAAYKEKAMAAAEEFRAGRHVREWFDPVKELARSGRCTS